MTSQPSGRQAGGKGTMYTEVFYVTDFVHSLITVNTFFFCQRSFAVALSLNKFDISLDQ